MKKLFLALFTILILLTVSVSVSANTVVAQGTAGGSINWALDSEGTMTLSGSGPMWDYPSPDQTPWYSHISSIRRLVVGNGVTSIGSYAFGEAANLVNLDMPNTVTAINEGAFGQCTSLLSVRLPSSLKTIGPAAFMLSGLNYVDLPASVTTVGEFAFAGCFAMEYAAVRGTVFFDYRAFYDCGSLRSVYFYGNAPSLGEEVFNNTGWDL
ncbi:MAG: leucine-rich repeat domain-containing protein, partial [Clostridia bacterium]|nr:leucine-rich repeat domain-containing protein [Clostridia bacterium]